MEKAVFKATRKDAVHPKQKHVDTLIQMTWSGASMEELFMLIQDRFSEANWVISFKALIVVHILMHEGNSAVIYDYLINRPNALDMTRFRDRHGTKGVSAFEQSKNVRTYASYLNDKVLAFKAIRLDHVAAKNPAGSQIYAKNTTDVKFLLLEVSTVQKQLHSVLKNRFDSDTLDNETTFSAFRYCLRDMLKLFQVMNLGVMKMLKIYFEVREDDMRRSLDLYKRFVKLTDRADEYLKIARRFEAIFGFTIPNLTHAPLSLSRALEDFLNMSADERSSTVGEMKKHAKKPTSPQPADQTASASNVPRTMSRTATSGSATGARSKPDYGLRLKPELAAAPGDPAAASSPVSAKATTTPTSITAGTVRATRDNTAGSQSKKAPEAKKETVVEKDFIDFFSSLDDETVAATDNTINVHDQVAVPAGTGIDLSLMQQQQQQISNNANDLEAMFQALSNPFAAQNTGSPAAIAGNASGSGSASGGQQQQAFFGMDQNQSAVTFQQLPAASSPFGAISNNLAGVQSTPQLVGSTMSTVSAPMPNFNDMSALGSAPFGNGMNGGVSAAMSSPSPFQTGAIATSQPAPFGDVSTNNPFRQSMFPQSDAQAQAITNQMAQMSFQQQQQQQPMPNAASTISGMPSQLQQQPPQQQQQQMSYNPFTQRQTMFITDQNTHQHGAIPDFSSPFGNSTNASVPVGGMQASNSFFASTTTTTSAASPFGNMGGIAMTQQQQQQQQQSVPASSAAQLQNHINNGNFADFDFFK